MTASTSSYAAVAPGTDLSRYARSLVRVHDAVLSGDKPPERPRRLVARSWERVMRLGLDPASSNGRVPPSAEELGRRREESPLSLVVDDLRGVLTGIAELYAATGVPANAHALASLVIAHPMSWRETKARAQLIHVATAAHMSASGAPMVDTEPRHFWTAVKQLQASLAPR